MPISPRSARLDADVKCLPWRTSNTLRSSSSMLRGMISSAVSPRRADIVPNNPVLESKLFHRFIHQPTVGNTCVRLKMPQSHMSDT